MVRWSTDVKLSNSEVYSFLDEAIMQGPIYSNQKAGWHIHSLHTSCALPYCGVGITGILHFIGFAKAH